MSWKTKMMMGLESEVLFRKQKGQPVTLNEM